MSAAGPKPEATVVKSDAQRIINQFRNSLQGEHFSLQLLKHRPDIESRPRYEPEAKTRLQTALLAHSCPDIEFVDDVASLQEHFDFLADSQARKLKIYVNSHDIDKLPQLTSGLQRLNIGVLEIEYSGHDIEQLKAILHSVKQVPILAHIYIYTHYFKDEEIKTLAPIISELDHLAIFIYTQKRSDQETDEYYESFQKQLPPKLDALHLQLGLFARTLDTSSQNELIADFTRGYPEDCVVKAKERILDGIASKDVRNIISEVITDFPDVLTDLVQQYLGKSSLQPLEPLRRYRAAPLLPAMSSSYGASSSSSSSAFSSSSCSAVSSSSSSSSSSCAVAAPARSITVMWPQLVEFVDPPVVPVSSPSSAAATVEEVEDAQMQDAPSRGPNKRRRELGDDRDAAEKPKQPKP